MESSWTKPIAEVPKSKNQKGEWENSRAEAEQLQLHSSKPTTQTTKQKKTNTHTTSPKPTKLQEKKRGGEPRSCEQTHPSSEEFLTYFSKPKNHILKLNQQSSSPITIITLLGVTKHQKHKKDQIKIQMFLMGIAKQKCMGISSISS
jgi:hypothetical protein